MQKQDPRFQEVFAKLERDLEAQILTDWNKTLGYMTPSAKQYGRTTILPALFDPNPTNYGGAAFGVTAALAGFALPPAYWRQAFIEDEHQVIIQGNRTGEVMPEDWKVGWLGLAFPNKNQHITEIKFQIGDRKYGRINLEEMLSYNKPAIIFEEPFILNEEQGFHLYGYFEGPIPESPFSPTATHTVDEVEHEHYCAYQRIVMLGQATYKIIDKALGAPGAAI